jgi:adenosylcobinamide-GDP ribazoletransferase
MGFFDALSFLTIIPTKANKSEFKDGGRDYWWAVGILIGSLDAVIMITFNRLFGTFVAAGFTLLFDGILTQFLHYDGLSDLSDALLGSKSRSKRLEILKDPNIGAFGFVLTLMLVLIRFSVYVRYVSSPFTGVLGFILLFATISALARALCFIVGHYFPVIEKSYLAKKVFENKVSKFELAVQFFICILMVLISGVTYDKYFRIYFVDNFRFSFVILFLVVTVVVMLMVTICLFKLATKRLGGINGDTIGAAILISETAGLLMGITRW